MSKIQISDLIDYIALLLNFEIKGKLIYLDVVEALESIRDLPEFKKELKSRVANLNDNYKYLNGFQKFTKIVEDYKNKQLLISDRENTQINNFSDILYKKLTWFFDEINWMLPNEEQLKKIDWKNHKKLDETNLFLEKELIVCDLIGDTLEIYRLATKNKPQLHEKTKKIVCELTIGKKSKALGIENRTDLKRIVR